MTDRKLLEHCYDQLRIMFNPDVSLMQKLTARLAQPEPEPVAWYDKHGMITHDPLEGVTPLYTAPPQRKWQGLTDEERAEFDKWALNGAMGVVYAIEAKLKEKNG